MPANLENSAVATGLGKVSFHFNPKEKQCQRMFKLPYNCTHLTCQQDFPQNLSSWVSAVCEPRTSRCKSWIEKRQRNQKSISNIHWIIEKAREFQKESTSADYTKAFDCGSQQEMGIPGHLTFLLRNLYAEKNQVRTGHGKTDWFQIGKGVHQGCILSPCLFNLYAEYIMQNAGLDESQTGIKIARRNISNLRYTGYTT